MLIMTHVQGMHGLGDNLHQRAIIKEMIKTQLVYLETPWPSVYHDLRGGNLKLVCRPSSLRTQTKNMTREALLFDMAQAPRTFGDRQLRIYYLPEDVRREGSVLGAMCATLGVKERDFSLPVPRAWKLAARLYLSEWDGVKPLLVYRPLVERTEWGGCSARNPSAQHYDEIFAAIRDQFFVVSIADLVPHIEWMVSKPIDADVELHAGELSFEAMAGLFSMASMVYASPGFAVPLAQAVGTPVVCVFGGYENSSSFSGGADLTPYLGIDTEVPCHCFSHKHACVKTIDVPYATGKLILFTRAIVNGNAARNYREIPDQLDLPLQAVHERGGVGDADHVDRVSAAETGD